MGMLRKQSRKHLKSWGVRGGQGKLRGWAADLSLGWGRKPQCCFLICHPRPVHAGGTISHDLLSSHPPPPPPPSLSAVTLLPTPPRQSSRSEVLPDSQGHSRPRQHLHPLALPHPRRLDYPRSLCHPEPKLCSAQGHHSGKPLHSTSSSFPALASSDLFHPSMNKLFSCLLP